ncbi:hypothetical protein HRW07_10085 [Streptomyces lunaelactis]|uniref:hypothetical protein n=1 Tax=Streptomyces lunaelactis TaxID=1535768 RepID=UPI001585D1B3|nr:hypothetical protein [Streptomyces lunaelactis]NUL03577.1 hypothetical protein [Streptomyces lunaelactis]
MTPGRTGASCGLCERDLQDGYLCPGDTLALAERLERLPKLYVALGAFLAPAVRPAGERVSSGQAEPPLPVNEAVLDLRYGGIALVLEGWRSDVQDVRGWGQPAIEGGIERRVLAAARSLGMSLEWIASSYPAAGDLAREVREMEGAALSIVDPEDPRDRGTRLGNCPAQFEDGVICGAVLRHRRGEASITCRWCNTVYPPESWLALAAGAWDDQDAEERQAS